MRKADAANRSVVGLRPLVSASTPYRRTPPVFGFPDGPLVLVSVPPLLSSPDPLHPASVSAIATNVTSTIQTRERRPAMLFPLGLAWIVASGPSAHKCERVQSRSGRRGTV